MGSQDNKNMTSVDTAFYTHTAQKDFHQGFSSRIFPSRISSVNVTKSAGNCGFGRIY